MRHNHSCLLGHKATNQANYVKNQVSMVTVHFSEHKLEDLKVQVFCPLELMPVPRVSRTL